MSPSAWIALGSLAVAISVHAAVVAFMMGRLFQRVTQVERDIGDRASMNDTVIELKVKMGHVETAVTKSAHATENMQRQLANIAMNKVGWSSDAQ